MVPDKHGVGQEWERRAMELLWSALGMDVQIAAWCRVGPAGPWSCRVARGPLGDTVPEAQDERLPLAEFFAAGAVEMPASLAASRVVLARRRHSLYSLHYGVESGWGEYLALHRRHTAPGFTATDAATLDTLHRLSLARQVLPPRSGFWQPPPLPARQQAVLIQLLEGRSEGQIAQSLGISPATVHVHVQRVYRRCQVHSYRELLRLWHGGAGAGVDGQDQVR